MGKIADLLEKKALGSITADEQKELDTLLREATLASEKTAKALDSQGRHHLMF
jgi:hypothetical protein